MKPAPFEYLAPDTVDEALSILQKYGSDAKLLAGGQSLVPAMNFRLAQPGILVDINKLAGLNYISEDGTGRLLLGAMTRQSRLETDSLISKRAPLLYEAMPHVAHPQIRNRGTLGGSLAHADPAAELPVIAVALGARFRIRSSQRERWIQAIDFFQGLFTTALEPEEMLVEIELPVTSPGTGWSFMEVARRHGDYALMGVAVLVTLDEQSSCTVARIVFLNAGDRPVEALESARMLIGKGLDDPAIDAAAANAASREIEPWGNVHASPDYQRHLARVLTHRALKQARHRAALPVN
jgi:carbon-monoxide dehydrogenase medium subunit